MTGDDGWDAAFASTSESDWSGGVDFKWGWNAATGEAAVWRVDGVDGAPAHEWYLADAWGRGPRFSAGDVVGIATAKNSDDTSDRGEIVITSFYGTQVPGSVVEWFAAEFPGYAVRGVERPNPESGTAG